MDDETEFLRAIWALKVLHPQRALLALHHALFSSNEEIIERSIAIPLPDALPDNVRPPRPSLRLVIGQGD